MMDQLPKSTSDRIERAFVKYTYDDIADDFSSTRYKKWPKVDQFLKSLPTDSLSLDIGCGNGKYLDNPTTYNIGCDLSLNLLKICKQRGFEVVLCDMTKLPFRQEIFDSAICIAALHHVISNDRRQKCLQDMTELMKRDESKLLIQVWSFEQNLDSDNPYLKKNPKPQEVLPKSVELADVRLPIHRNRTQFLHQDVLVPFQTKSSSEDSQHRKLSLRYYHVFKKDELDFMLNKIPNIGLLDSYYDRGNWCAIVARH